MLLAYQFNISIIPIFPWFYWKSWKFLENSIPRNSNNSNISNNSKELLKRSAPPPLRKSLGFGDFGVFGNLWRSGFSVGLPKITKLPTITEIPKVLKRPGPPKSREPGLTSSKTFGICVIFGICDLFNCLASGGAGLFENLWDFLNCDIVCCIWGWSGFSVGLTEN